jgi:hypothetical protein
VIEERLHEHDGGALRIGPISLGVDVAVAVRRMTSADEQLSLDMTMAT